MPARGGLEMLTKMLTKQPKTAQKKASFLGWLIYKCLILLRILVEPGGIEPPVHPVFMRVSGSMLTIC